MQNEGQNLSCCTEICAIYQYTISTDIVGDAMTAAMTAVITANIKKKIQSPPLLRILFLLYLHV